MTKIQEQQEFVAVMTRELRGRASVDDLRTLMKLARRHGRICERECNGHQTPSGDWDREAAERDERAGQRVEEEIRELCAELGCTPLFSGDPRGATVKVVVPSGRSNSWGGEGICVPQ